jgi:hypothetical protein
MRLDEIDPALAKTLHRATNHHTARPVKEPSVNHQRQPILPALNPSGSWPPVTQTMQGGQAIHQRRVSQAYVEPSGKPGQVPGATRERANA